MSKPWFNLVDGKKILDEERLNALEENLKSVTDHTKLVDDVFKAMKVGRSMVLAFQCGHSGLYMPADYVKNWGRGYGIGHGPHPVSEVLDTDYHTAPPAITPETESLDQIMHPVGTTFAQVDYMLVDEAVFNSEAAVLVRDDPHMRKRSSIVRNKQMINPRSKLPNMAALWNMTRKGGY